MVPSQTFFDSKMVEKKNSYAKYEYGVDEGLAVVIKDGKAALVQNSLIINSEAGLRNAEIECLIVDETGIIYQGKIKSNLVDYDSDIKQVRAVLNLLANNDSRVIKDGKSVDIFVESFGDSAINISFRMWVKTADFFALKFDIQEHIIEKFREKGINIPYNKLDVNINQ